MEKILRTIQVTLLNIAKISANTPSQIGLYQPKVPKKLKKEK